MPKKLRKTKRYMFTLTEGRIELLQQTIRLGGLSPSWISSAIDTYIASMNSTFAKIQKTGRYGTSDMFKAIGEQLELLEVEEKKEVKGHAKNQRKTTSAK